MILQEISEWHSDPYGHSLCQLPSILWPDHPLGHDQLGTVEQLRAIDAKLLKQAHQLGYSRNRTVLFIAGDIERGRIVDCFDIQDVWPENYSVNSVQKVWAAKFAARHPHVAVVDLSSFKCGYDAPVYNIIDRILGASGTPYLALHDIDANKPGGSINIRLKTFIYTLERYQEKLLRNLEVDVAMVESSRGRVAKT